MANVTMFLVNFFKMCCYRSRFQLLLLRHLTFHKVCSVATHLRCGGIFSDSIITNFLPILTAINDVHGMKKGVPCIVYEIFRDFLCPVFVH